MSIPGICTNNMKIIYRQNAKAFKNQSNYKPTIYFTVYFAASIGIQETWQIVSSKQPLQQLVTKISSNILGFSKWWRVEKCLPQSDSWYFPTLCQLSPKVRLLITLLLICQCYCFSPLLSPRWTSSYYSERWN